MQPQKQSLTCLDDDDESVSILEGDLEKEDTETLNELLHNILPVSSAAQLATFDRARNYVVSLLDEEEDEPNDSVTWNPCFQLAVAFVSKNPMKTSAHIARLVG